MIWTIIWFGLAAVMIAIDQVTKVLAVKYLADGPTVVIPGVLNFSYVENDGMAMGLLDEHRWIFMTLSTVAIIGLIVYMIGWKPKSKFACAALSLIIGGGIGNMIDRFFYVGILEDTLGEKVVRDFIDVTAFGDLWIWVFNIADACVCVGGAMLFLWCVVSIIKEEKAARVGAGDVKTKETVATDIEEKAENKIDRADNSGEKE